MIELITGKLVSNWIETSKESVWRLFFVDMIIIHFVLVKGMFKYNVYNFN